LDLVAAIDATLRGRSLEDAAKEHPQLKAALEAWVNPFKGMGM
jgi:ribulose 1,5-bisphosphate carboxylase large subunit-like protein